jgi:hypothetical protein
LLTAVGRDRAAIDSDPFYDISQHSSTKTDDEMKHRWYKSDSFSDPNSKTHTKTYALQYHICFVVSAEFILINIKYYTTILLQYTRKEDNWETEETLARAAVTMETERAK